MRDFIKNLKYQKIIKNSEFFDIKYYLFTYPDVRKADIDPIVHYLKIGAKEGRNPNFNFNTSFYLEEYTDVLKADINPLVHYIINGKKEGRFTNRYEFDRQLIEKSNYFDQKYYIDTYPDVKNAKIDPIDHYLKIGAKEGRNPHPNFNTSFYLKQYHDIIKIYMNPLAHYISNTETVKNLQELNKQLIEKSEYFDNNYYLDTYSDIKNAGINPIEHFLLDGAKEGRNPSKNFNTIYYHNKYLKGKDINPLIHFIKYGEKLAHKTSPNISSHINCIPHYLNASYNTYNYMDNETKIAIHIHLKEKSNLDLFIPGLVSLEKFDLFISLEKTDNTSNLSKLLKEKIPKLNTIQVRIVKNNCGDIAPLIIEFGQELLSYDVIGHFHANINSITENSFTQWHDSLNLILKYDENTFNPIPSILYLLHEKANIVFPSTAFNANNTSIKTRSHELAKKFLNQFSPLSDENNLYIDCIQETMFWAKSTYLKELLTLPLKYSDFSLTEEDTISQVFQQLFSALVTSDNENIYTIYATDSLIDYKYYEEQENYSSKIIHTDIKILSYYLPQFHPIPENDEWHGKGFTEWTKVKNSNPLFQGHYQQHIPHNDIGYYLLDTPEILKKQADMMKQSGVYGQIFYHYWFTGKLILEEPVKMLFDNKDIDMPFSFCWANENWTRRWDGNDDDILLEQIYSEDDARNFIRYLIPFFQDERYIHINNRPVLYVYRPSSIPNVKQYINIWSEECQKASLLAPYVIAVLTRGATDPNDFYMDAGVERILHDWTNGNVSEINHALETYGSLNGSVLPYDKVAEYYTNQTDNKDFTYFRSISPIWDNTARYAEDAYLLHHSTPNYFQTWLEKLIEYTQYSLEENKHFIVVNAWNEWAEGAHLEPDTYYGYSYLNSIGRALSKIPYKNNLSNISEIPKNTTIHISLSYHMINELSNDITLKQRFIKCLLNSTLFNNDIKFSSNSNIIVNNISFFTEGSTNNANYIFEFKNTILFDSDTLIKMLYSIIQNPYSILIANDYNHKHIYNVTENLSIDRKVLDHTSICLYSNEYPYEKLKNVRMQTDSKCFITLPNKKKFKITTIIRFHKGANFEELKNALYCLATMQDCLVTPYIAAQDLNDSQKIKLQELLISIPFEDSITPTVKHYTSKDGNGDMRTIMLNESLKKVQTKFVAFLDYDDLLFTNAYSTLITRLMETSKAVTFGRVYSTTYNSTKKIITDRKKIFEYGYTYQSFMHHNNLPLHSFVMDLTKLNLNEIIYHDNQIYMEDYYLTMQLFTYENADWESLKFNIYIGDYIHSSDRDHTLAFTNDNEKVSLLDDSNYQRDAKRIIEIRKQKI